MSSSAPPNSGAAKYCGLAYELIEEKFSMHKRALPCYMLFGDRPMSFQPHVTPQDNYHPPRQLMLNILTLDRMLQRGRTNVVEPLLKPPTARERRS